MTSLDTPFSVRYIAIMIFFLQGTSGVGKSALLKESLAPFARDITGFFVQELLADGRRVGSRAVMLKGCFPPPEVTYLPAMTGVFILRGQYDASVPERMILRVEEAVRTSPYKLILLDEIGGIELASPVFMAALKRLLMGEISCAGVFKCRENLARTVSNLGLGAEYFTLHKELENLLRASGELITVTEQNQNEIANYISSRFLNGI